MTSESPRRVVPQPDALTQPFWDAAAKGQLVVQQRPPAAGVKRLQPHPLFEPRHDPRPQGHFLGQRLRQRKAGDFNGLRLGGVGFEHFGQQHPVAAFLAVHQVGLEGITLFGRQFPPQIPAGDVVPVDEGVVHILSPRLHTLRPRLCHSPKSMVD